MHTKQSKSFHKKILVIFLIGYSCIIGALVFYSLYLNYSYNQSILQTGNAMLNLYVDELDDLLERNNTYLLKTIIQNVNATVLESPNSTDVEKFSAAYDLNQELGNQLTLEKGIAGFVTLYDNEVNSYYTFQKQVSFDDTRNIMQFIGTGMDKEGLSKNWVIVRGATKSYLVLTYHIRGTSLSVVIDFEAVTSDLINKYSSGDTQIVFNDSTGLLDYQKTAGIDFALADNNSKLVVKSNNHILISKVIANTDLTMNILIPDGSTVAIQWSQIYVIWILLLALGCALFSYYYIYKKLIRPINQMTDTMKKIMDGELDAKMPEHTGINEYEQTGKVFNSMMSQIKELRIKTYEDEIVKQKSRWQYLQLQIKPHFYLNGLKTLYALLQQQKYKELENAIIDISQFLRYIFLDIFSLVSVKEELSFTQNYLNMQKGSTRMEIDCDLSVDPSVIDEEILPLTIQTFVENSVKYAEVEDKLVLKIRIKRLEGEETDYLDIVVSDNGQGYAEEWLEKMNWQDNDEYEGEHIGIINLKKRIQLQYGEKAEFVVRNSQGAISEVILPIKKPIQITEKAGSEYECSGG